MILFAFMFVCGGYALTYYGIDVLVWAHGSIAVDEPVPLAACLGFPMTDRGAPFMPPFTLGAQIPGAITDARGLLGGVPTTGTYATVTAQAASSGGAADTATDQSGGTLPTTDGGTPLTSGGTSGATPASVLNPALAGGAAKAGYAAGFLNNTFANFLGIGSS